MSLLKYELWHKLLFPACFSGFSLGMDHGFNLSYSTKTNKKPGNTQKMQIS